MLNQEEVIRAEFDAIVRDIKAIYNASGKRVSGQFEKELEITQNGTTTALMGVPYLAGRSSGKMPPVDTLKKWVEAKGITPLKGTTTSLAWAIAKKIAKEGTSKEYHLKVYEQVITPERIDSIIQKVAVFNVNLFTTELKVELKKLQNNI